MTTKQDTYIVSGVIKISKKFTKTIQANSAEEAKAKVLQEVGSSGEAIIDYVLVKNEQQRRIYG